MGIRCNTDSLVGLEKWPVELVEVVKELQRRTHGQAVMPARARTLVRHYIDPLVPGLGVSRRIRPQHPSWEDFRQAGREIARRSGNRLEACVGDLLIVLPEWARSRKATGRQYRTYCELCWRHVVAKRKFCSHHDPQTNQAGYRQARRMLDANAYLPEGAEPYPRFHSIYGDWIGAMREFDVLGANQAWEQVIKGELSLSDWLHSYRERVVAYISTDVDTRQPITRSQLLSALDAPDPGAESSQMLAERTQLHGVIDQNPEQLSGMLRRAEAWLAIKELYRKYHPRGRRRKRD